MVSQWHGLVVVKQMVIVVSMWHGLAVVGQLGDSSVGCGEVTVSA